jgi:hypothetical protein
LRGPPPRISPCPAAHAAVVEAATNGDPATKRDVTVLSDPAHFTVTHPLYSMAF